MRTCRQCGGGFSIYRHVFRRGEFCSENCAEAYLLEDSRRMAWEVRGQADQSHAPISNTAIESKGTLRPSVTQLQEGRGEPRLYFIGADVPEFRLAQSMGPGRAIFGVAPPWPLAWRNAATMPTMAQIAAPYTAAIAAHAPPFSRCVMVGYSFSGTIAFESARQLLADGVNIEMVVLIDSRPRYPIATVKIMSKRLRNIWSEPLESSFINQILSISSRAISSSIAIEWMCARKARDLLRSLIRTILRDPGPLSDIFDAEGVRLRWGLLEKMIHIAGKSYQLQHVDCRGALIRVDQKRERLARELDPSLGWRDLFDGGLEIINIAGDHITIMRQAQSNLILAQTINDLVAVLQNPRSPDSLLP